MAEKHPDRFDPPMAQAVERRVVQRRDYLNPKAEDPISHMWFRVPGDIGDDRNRHQTLIAFISDFALLGAALLPHPYTAMSKKIQAASLDHAIWFHRPFRADEWLLFAKESPNAGGARGFVRGHFFNRAGEMVATAAQECLIRPIGNNRQAIEAAQKAS